MEYLVALLINLLILAIIVVVVFWVLGLLAETLGFPPKVLTLLKAIIALIVLLWLVHALSWHGAMIYPLPVK